MIPQPPEDPRALRRNRQITIAGYLSFILAGLLFAHALGDVGDPLRWVSLIAWVVIAITGQIIAWRR